MGNLYDILGLTQDASDVDIKRAFRRLSLELHPDRTNSLHSGQYTEVIKAYETLSDREKRAQYDKTTGRQESDSRKRTGRIIVEEAASDEDVDSRKYGSKSRWVDKDSPNLQPQPLPDIYEEVSVSLEDCYNGTAVPVSVVRQANGREEKTMVYVEIPKGTDHGEMLMKEGMGNRSGMYRSNLVVKVNVIPHKFFERQGLNLKYNMRLSLKESICGFTRELEHLDGKTYKIASESDVTVQPGAKRVIVGKGFSRDEYGIVGHLLIVFDIALPENLTRETKETLERLLP
jgi:DnaJ-class molecular chaperone